MAKRDVLRVADLRRREALAVEVVRAADVGAASNDDALVVGDGREQGESEHGQRANDELRAEQDLEAVFRDGTLTEAAACNVLAVKDGVLLAPPKNNLILPGITYDVVLELAAANKIPLEMRAVSEQEVRSAQEIWLTSSTKEVLAVTTLDGRPVGNGKPGPLFQRMHALYQDFKKTVMRRAA